MGALAGRKVVVVRGAVKIKGFSKHDITFDQKSIDCTEYDPDSEWTKSDVGMCSGKMTISGFMRVDDLAQSGLRSAFFSHDVIQDLTVYHDYANTKGYTPDLGTDPEAGWRISQFKTGATVAGMVTVDFTLESYGAIKEI